MLTDSWCSYCWSSQFCCRVIMFNATFNNISVIPWQSALLVEETLVTGDGIWVW